MNTINFFTVSGVPKIQFGSAAAISITENVTVIPDASLSQILILQDGRIIFTIDAANTLQVEGSTITGTLGQKSDLIAGVLKVGTSSGVASNLTPTAIKTSAYTAAANELVKTDATSGAVPITFPTGLPDKTRIAVKMVFQSGTNATTIALSGTDVFNKTGGGTSASILLLNQTITFQYESGTGIWTAISSDTPISQLDARYTPLTAENYKTLTDAPVINWAYVNGDIATINISGSVLRTSLNITGITGASIKTGELFVTHTDAGTTIPLPGNSDNVGWNPSAGGVTWLAFRYFNSQFNWTSNFPASVAVDTAAPVLLSAIVSGFTPTRVRLTFNENLSSKVNFLTTDFTFATGRTATVISVSGPYLDIDVNTAYTTADIGSMKISGGNSKIKDIVGNTKADLVNQDISFTDIVLTANAVLPLTSSAAKFGGPVAIELLNKDSSTLVTRAGTVNKVRFVLSAVPTGCTFGIIVWRNNGTGYDLVMRAIYDYTKLVVGTNTDIVPTPFSVLVGDNVGFIYTTPGTTGAWIPTIDNAVAASSRYTTTSPATPTSGYLWDSKSASTSFSPAQLIQ